MASSTSGRRAQELITYPCSLCDIKENVNWFCNDCQEALCDRCKELHTRGKKTKSDDVVSIGKANRQDAKPVPEVCKLHPGKLCDGYCCDCDMLVCLLCLSQTHKHHDWGHLEDELTFKKQQVKEHIKAISLKITHYKNETSRLYLAKKEIVDNIEGKRKEVNSRRTKLKAEVDSIADTVLTELTALEEEQLAQCDKVCQQFEKKTGELTRLLEKAQLPNALSISVFETENTLRSTLPLYDVEEEHFILKQLSFGTGGTDRGLLTKMFGKLRCSTQYVKTDICSKHVQRLSNFTVFQKEKNINDICPIDDNHAWLSIEHYKGLVLVSIEGVVPEELEMDFFPLHIMRINKDDIIMTSVPRTTSIYKLTPHSKRVTIFADISPHEAVDISVNETGEVFVSTGTPEIVVLNQSGTIVRNVSNDTGTPRYVTCLSSGNLGLVLEGEDWNRNIIITDESGAILNRWTGELDNGKKVLDLCVWKMSSDQYDRLFVPDPYSNQVYVLPCDEKLATCLLDQKHGVKKPSVVSVDTFGNVWIGCCDGTIHVMRL